MLWIVQNVTELTKACHTEINSLRYLTDVDKMTRRSGKLLPLCHFSIQIGGKNPGGLIHSCSRPGIWLRQV